MTVGAMTALLFLLLITLGRAALPEGPAPPQLLRRDSPSVQYQADCEEEKLYEGPSCDTFYICMEGRTAAHQLVLFSCGQGTMFDAGRSVCVHATKSRCQDGNTDGTENNFTPRPTTEGTPRPPISPSPTSLPATSRPSSSTPKPVGPTSGPGSSTPISLISIGTVSPSRPSPTSRPSPPSPTSRPNPPSPTARPSPTTKPNPTSQPSPPSPPAPPPSKPDARPPSPPGFKPIRPPRPSGSFKPIRPPRPSGSFKPFRPKPKPSRPFRPFRPTRPGRPGGVLASIFKPGQRPRPLISIPTFGLDDPDQQGSAACPQYSLDGSSLINCTREGRWEHPGDCNRFYQCIHTMDCVLKGFIFRCPEDYHFTKSSGSCEELFSPKPCHKFSDTSSSSFTYPVIQLEQESIKQFQQASAYWDYMPFLTDQS